MKPLNKFSAMALEKYLAPSHFIDWQHQAVAALAANLAQSSHSEMELAQRCFEWVRDEIRHSWDYQQNPVTCKASDVLLHGTGYCYAKSHLLAALLRANGIPAGLCYQRLSLEDAGPPYCLHGLNAVYLKEFGWYRIDARGNKPGVNAEFQPPIESLAFSVDFPGEWDFTEIYVEPLSVVSDVLTRCSNIADVYQQLPDVPNPADHQP